ncbi:MAG: hypothetical protein LBU90_09015 [Bacteroidales bacterium]|jgi:hypothetical protein|nr:hypothetical protein [Bacteroidales bacterium]
MIKKTLQFLLATILYTVLLVLANAFLPFSQGFKELGTSGDHTMTLLGMLISSAWTCFAITFVITHTCYSGKRLFLNLLFVFFFVQSFMTQIETLFFGNAFAVLTKWDIILIMLVGVFPLAGTIPLLIKFFQHKKGICEKPRIHYNEIALKLCVIGVIYLCVYMLFGYFVAWQFEELRLFYTGSPEKLSFMGQMANNLKTNPVIIPFQILRGILFGIAVLPIKNMVTRSKSSFITSVILIYLTTAIMLIIPNVLFPETVRIAHLIEMSTSMLVFGIIVGTILWKNKEKTTSERT